MTSMDSYDASGAHGVPEPRGMHDIPAAPARRRVPMELGPDPVHPDVSNLSPAPHEEIAQMLPPLTTETTGTTTNVPATPATATGSDDRPIAADLGVPAVFEHQVVALEVGSAVSPVAVHSWTGEQVSTLLLTPTQAQVWARAGRLTLATAEGDELPFTVLAPEEGASARLGAHWPLGEPDGRVRRIAAAAAHDVGDLLTFPAWLARTAHVSGERNNQLARLVNRIRTASPSTAIYYGQTFGQLHARPDQHHPYDHKGLVGHEGWPGEL